MRKSRNKYHWGRKAEILSLSEGKSIFVPFENSHNYAAIRTQCSVYSAFDWKFKCKRVNDYIKITKVMKTKETIYDKWWASLTIWEKERIAGKISKQKVSYPDCTDVWNKLSDESKGDIVAHCQDKHGLKLIEWFEGKPYGD